jgi:spore coat polysaccharide biosynthesis predicted glycosyltransferase SpsG
MDGEIEVIEDVIKSNNIEKLLIDSYQVTESYLERLTSITKTYYIDDVNSFKYPVSAIICYAVYHEKFNYKSRYSEGDTEFYLGPQFTPLRKEFTDVKDKDIKDSPEEILVLSGGADQYDILYRMIDSGLLERYKKVNVVCGKYYKNIERLQKLAGEKGNIFIIQNASNLIDYMIDADIAISAGGTTLYELCACGTPTISYIIADNQMDNVKTFDSIGLIPFAFDGREDRINESLGEVLKRFEDRDYRMEKNKLLKEFDCSSGSKKIAALLR